MGFKGKKDSILVLLLLLVLIYLIIYEYNTNTNTTTKNQRRTTLSSIDHHCIQSIIDRPSWDPIDLKCIDGCVYLVGLFVLNIQINTLQYKWQNITVCIDRTDTFHRSEMIDRSDKINKIQSDSMVAIHYRVDVLSTSIHIQINLLIINVHIHWICDINVCLLLVLYKYWSMKCLYFVSKFF